MKAFLLIVAFMSVVMFAMAEGDLHTLTHYFGYSVISTLVGVVFGIRAYRTLSTQGVDRDSRIGDTLLVVAIAIPLAAVCIIVNWIMGTTWTRILW